MKCVKRSVCAFSVDVYVLDKECTRVCHIKACVVLAFKILLTYIHALVKNKLHLYTGSEVVFSF